MTAPKRRPTPALPERLEHVYLIGVCGTAMGSLAGMLAQRGLKLSGSDQATYPPMSDFLAGLGITVLQGYQGENLRGLEPPPDLVVVGNVCRKDNPEVLAAQELGLPLFSLPELLRLLFLERVEQRVVVSGTHGKTTTSSLLAWLLENARRDPSFMIGGIAANFDSNFKLGQSPIFVVEGDEYDTAFFDKVPKFWHYEPTVLLINNIEYDHADIYASLDEIVDVFAKLVRSMHPRSVIWANLRDANVRQVVKAAPCPVHGFGLGAGVELRADKLATLPNGGLRFELSRAGQRLGTIRSPLNGLHNVANTLGAIGACLSLRLSFSEIASGIESFKGVRRRQEQIGEAHGVTIYDDFAHHPTAVRETLLAIRGRHPNARLWAVFEAKSNTSRRAIFQDAYPDALAEADRVVLSAPWRKTPNAAAEANSIDLGKLVEVLEARGKTAQLLPEVDEIVNYLVAECQAGDVVLGMSGSSFGNLHRKLLARLLELDAAQQASQNAAAQDAPVAQASQNAAAQDDGEAAEALVSTPTAAVAQPAEQPNTALTPVTQPESTQEGIGDALPKGAEDVANTSAETAALEPSDDASMPSTPSNEATEEAGSEDASSSSREPSS